MDVSYLSFEEERCEVESVGMYLLVENCVANSTDRRQEQTECDTSDGSELNMMLAQ